MAGPLGMILTVLFWGVVVVFIVKVYQVMFPGQTTAQNSRSVDILKERYAAGEISRQEFERMRKDMNGS